MKPVFRLAAMPLLFLLLTGMTNRQDFMVRFCVEANEQDTDRFSQPIQFKYPPRTGYVERVPTVTERDIKGVFPFHAPDGSLGCTFKLDSSGRLRLEVASSEQKGRSMVVFVGTKKGTHQVIDMVIDQKISDGVVTIQKGLTPLEIKKLQQRYPTIGGKKKVAEF